MQASTQRKILSEDEYGQIINRLCHILPLTKEGKTKEAVDNLIVTVLAVDGSAKPKNVDDVIAVIDKCFHQSLT